MPPIDLEDVEQEIFNVLIGEFPNASTNEWVRAAQNVARALAERGLLVEPGSTTHRRWKAEWYETWPGDRARRRTRVVSTEAEVDAWLAQIRPDEKPRKFVRTIRTSPFREVGNA